MAPTVKQIAEAGIEHALRFIEFTPTGVRSDPYSSEKLTSTNDVVRGMRIRSDERLQRLNEAKKQGYIFNLFNSKRCFDFETSVVDIIKFRTGNCYEMAILALDYALHHAPNVSGEILNIIGKGEKGSRATHSVAVFNRKPHTNPNKPEEWGDDAYICDPWSKKVYPAREFWQNMILQYHDINDKQNKTRPFEKTDRIDLDLFYTEDLHKELNIKFLNETFQKELMQLQSKLSEILSQYIDALFEIANQNPSNLTLSKVFTEKIKSIRNYLENLDAFEPALIHDETKFNEAFENYNAIMKNLLTETVKHIEFDQHTLDILFPKKTLLENVKVLFFKESDPVIQQRLTATSINEAIQQANRSLLNLKK